MTGLASFLVELWHLGMTGDDCPASDHDRTPWLEAGPTDCQLGQQSPPLRVFVHAGEAGTRRLLYVDLRPTQLTLAV